MLFGEHDSNRDMELGTPCDFQYI